jgi:hypothetical protein
MEWQGSIAILNRGGLRGKVQNFANDTAAQYGVSLAGNGLMQNGSRNVIVHNHTCDWYHGIVLDTPQHGIPLILPAHGKNGPHFFPARHMQAGVLIVVLTKGTIRRRHVIAR